jgi:hypothetical protein
MAQELSVPNVSHAFKFWDNTLKHPRITFFHIFFKSIAHNQLVIGRKINKPRNNMTVEKNRLVGE